MTVDEDIHLEPLPSIRPAFASSFQEPDIQKFLNIAEISLRRCSQNMKLAAKIIRKERSVGLIPETANLSSTSLLARRTKVIEREELDECVLVTQKTIQYMYAHQRVQDSVRLSLIMGFSWVDVNDIVVSYSDSI
jgi:hypothetical protein